MLKEPLHGFPHWPFTSNRLIIGLATLAVQGQEEGTRKGVPELWAAPAQRAAAEEHTRRSGLRPIPGGKSPEMTGQGAAAAPHRHGERQRSSRRVVAGSSRRAPLLHRGSRAPESVRAQRLPLLPARGRAAQPVMSAAPGAGPGAATAPRGSAHQVPGRALRLVKL